MTIEQRVKALENRLSSLQESLSQFQKNQTPVTETAENANFKVDAITPTTLTKTAYLDDTEVIFTDVPAGNMTVYFDKPYTVERDNNIVRITFEPLEEVTTVTISIL